LARAFWRAQGILYVVWPPGGRVTFDSERRY
jgi:hypothetical protein